MSLPELIDRLGEGLNQRLYTGKDEFEDHEHEHGAAHQHKQPFGLRRLEGKNPQNGAGNQPVMGRCA